LVIIMLENGRFSTMFIRKPENGRSTAVFIRIPGDGRSTAVLLECRRMDGVQLCC
jgi:hypothetical protein